MKLSRLRTREALVGGGFVLPAFLLLLVFSLIPIVLAGYISLFDYPLVNPARREFIGLANYIKAFSDSTVGRAFVNTAYYALWQVPVQTVMALVLAMLIEKPLRFVGIFRTGFYLPVVVSMVVASVLWMVMLNSQSGLVNSFLIWLGIPRQPLLLSETQALPVLALMSSWKWVGLGMLVFLTGLQSIPNQYYEAAIVDGANGLQQFWYITLPLLKRSAVYVIVTVTIDAFKFFTPVYIITKGGPQNSTLTILYHIFREAFDYNRLGYASAIAIVFTALLIIFAIFQLRLLRSED